MWTPRGVVSTRPWGCRGASILAFSLALKAVKLCNCHIFRPLGVHVNGLRSKGVQFCRLVVDVEGYTAVEFLLHCILHTEQ